MMDEWEAREEEAYLAMIDEYMRQLAEGPVFHYLATYGDAIQERVEACITEAEALDNAGFAGAALARAVTAIEIIVGAFLVRPLIYGAFLSDEWADVIVKRLLQSGARGVPAARELLPPVLRNWGLDITLLRNNDGSLLWESVQGAQGVVEQRNRYVHAGERADQATAQRAVECARRLLTDVVDPLASRLGFTRHETGLWSLVNSAHDRELNPPRKFDRRDPFART